MYERVGEGSIYNAKLFISQTALIVRDLRLSLRLNDRLVASFFLFCFVLFCFFVCLFLRFFLLILMNNT